MCLVVMVRYCGFVLCTAFGIFYVAVLERRGLLCRWRGGWFYGCVFYSISLGDNVLPWCF